MSPYPGPLTGLWKLMPGPQTPLRVGSPHPGRQAHRAHLTPCGDMAPLQVSPQMPRIRWSEEQPVCTFPGHTQVWTEVTEAAGEIQSSLAD